MNQTDDARLIEKAKEAYDDVWYVGYPFQQTHPDRLAMLARLFGMQPAPVEQCRVLELGCGDGTNLIAMAYGLPNSQFVGIDLAPKPLEYGTALSQELGLKNLELRAGDIREVDESWGKFDYIIAHGFYSWVPDFVREQLMVLCEMLLAPQGVVYISYNAHPGNRVHQMMREMMDFHVRGENEPEAAVKQGIGLLQFLASRFQGNEKGEEAIYPSLLNREIKRLTGFMPSQVYHDDFSPANTSFYFYQFIEHAAAHGLQYLAEADFFEMQDFIYPEPIREFLSQFSDDQIVTKEQYMDFLKCRQFRQTLLCRKDVKLNREINPQQLHAFYLASPARCQSTAPDLRPEVVEKFHGAKKSVLSTDYPLAKAALWYLGEIYPRSVTMDELTEAARQHLINNGLKQSDNLAVEMEADRQETDMQEADTLVNIIFAACRSGLVEMHAHTPRFVSDISERPVASRLARLQGRRGKVASTLVHKNLEMEDRLGQTLLQLLDGTRDHAALVDDLVAFVIRDGTFKKPDGTIPDENEVRQILDGGLGTNLQKLARMALLEA